MKFIVYLHLPTNHGCGGVVVQLMLARALYERGVSCKIVCPHGNTENPIYNIFGSIDDIDDDTYVIYSEGITGNPLGAKNVIRWILYGTQSNVSNTFLETDIIYYFLPFCKLNNSLNKLTCIYLNPNIYNKNIQRDIKSCFIIRKGNNYSKNHGNNRSFGLGSQKKRLVGSLRLIDNSLSLNIDYLRTHDEYIEIFNRSKLFFCYDPACFLTIIALMCGCIVIQDPMAGYSEEEWLRTCAGSTERLKGLAYGIGNLPFAIATIHEAPEQCRRLIDSVNSSIDTFIQQMKDKTYSTDKCYDFDSSSYSFQHGYFKNKVMNNHVGIH